MKNISRRAVKSITRNALLISMVLHVFLMITLFYVSVSDQSLLSFQDKLDVTLETVPKPPLSKKPIHQQQKTTVFEAAKISITEVESIIPQITFQPHIAPTSPVVAEKLRLKQTNTAPDVEVNVSTALHQLREAENGLSKTEAAVPTLDSSFGSKRSGGVKGLQRAPTRSTLDFAETVGGSGIAQIGDIFENKPSLPNIPFTDVMRDLASEIIATSDGGPIDVVFVIDASGSMRDNIEAVANHVIQMIDVYQSSGIDYALGLTEFYAPAQNVIIVQQLTKNLSKYKKNINAVFSRRGENALDAIEETIRKMRFRATSKKHFIVVTDEPFTSIEGKTVYDTIKLCNEFGIYVNVLGLPSEEHQLLAARTQGSWYAIPGNY